MGTGPAGRRARWLLPILVALGFLPGLARAQSVPADPAVLVETAWTRALLGFLLLTAAGRAVLWYDPKLIDRSLDASRERPFVSLLYGVMAQVLVVFTLGVFSTQLANVGLDPQFLAVGSTVVLGVALLGLAGVGIGVVGAWLTDLRGERDPATGLVVVAGICAIWLLVLPLAAGVAVCGLVVATGVGGPTRRWVHADRSVETEAEHG